MDEYEKYIRNLRLFYSLVSRRHPRQAFLNESFKLFIEYQVKKQKKYVYHGLVPGPSSKNMLHRVQRGTSIEHRSVKTIKDKPKLVLDQLYSSNIFQNCLVFAYLHMVYIHRNFSQFISLRQQLSKERTASLIMSGADKRRFNYAWERIDQILSGRRRVHKAQSQLLDSFKELNDEFIAKAFRVIIGIELPDSAKPEEWLSALQYQNTLTIDYFEADAYSLQRQAQYGQGKIKISIGYIQDEQAYIYVSKIPQKQSLQAKSSSIMNKLAGIAEGLLSQFNNDNDLLVNLNCLNVKRNTLLAKSTFDDQLSQIRIKQQSIVINPNHSAMLALQSYL